MASDQRMRIILDAVDNASAPLGRVESALGGLESVVGGVLGGLSAGAIVRAGVELANLGAQADALEGAFRNLASSDPDAFLEKLRAAARGTIDDMSLMQSANKAAMLGVTKDADELARLLEVASARGRAMGLSTQQAFNDIVTGIGRVSPLILDNLGILTGGQAGFQAYAESIGKTSEQLTDMERRQYLVNKVLEDTTPLLNSNAQKAEHFAASLENLKQAIGKELGWVQDVKNWVAEAVIDPMIEAQNKDVQLGGMEDAWLDSMRVLRQEGELTGLQFTWLKAQAWYLGEQFLSGALTIDEYTAAMAALEPAGGLAAEGIQQAGSAALATASGLSVLEARARAAQGALMDLYLAEVTGITTYLQPLQRTNYTRPQYQQQAYGSSGIIMGNGEMMTPGQSGIVAREELRDQYRDFEKEQERIARSLASGARGAASAAEDAAEQYQSSLRGLAESILQPSSVSEADMLRTRLGTYEGYWDEYVRRLQSAATDSNSAWRHMIPGDVLAQGADAMRLWVEQEKEAFYAGQRLESVDWDAFTKAAEEEQARRAAREALVAEGVRRLGGTMTQSEVAGLLGVGTTGQDSGAAYVEQFTAGAAQADVGGQLTATIDAQFRANEPEWMAMGRLTMGFFLKGAQESVNGDMVRGLWNALLPHMGDWMARQGSKP